MHEALLKNKNVLVVEDNAINQLVVKHTLTKLGATTDISGNGEDAIEKVRENEYDFILMDIQMPGIDGYETTQVIRHQLKNNIPIIAMTALALKGEDEKCYESGMNGYVSKPFTLESLYAAINKVFSMPQVIISNPNILSSQGVSVDISMLYQIAGNDDSYISTMINTFLENFPVTITKMENCIISKDWDGVYRSAHYAKSSLSVIKIKEMCEAVEKIEACAKNKSDLHKISPLLAQVRDKFEIVSNILLEKFGIEA